MVLHEGRPASIYLFFCRNCRSLITMEACLAMRETTMDGSKSCAGCSKDTLITRTTRGLFHTPGRTA